MVQNELAEISIWFLTAIVFVIPFSLLIVSSSLFFPYITGKALYFRYLVEFGLLIAFFLFLLNSRILNYRDPLLISLVIFFFIFLLATIFSFNPYRSFWGNAERSEGFWGIVHYLGYFVLLSIVFATDKKNFIWQAVPFIFSGVIISLITWEKHFQGVFRPEATLGNPSYVGTYLMLLIFLSWWFLYKLYENFNFPKNKLIFLIIGIGLTIFFLITILFSGTRSAILGFLAGILTSIVISLYLLPNRIYKILVPIILITSIIGFYFFLQTPLAEKIPGVSRFSLILKGKDLSYMPRLIAWQIFLEGFKARPILGWGPETSPFIFYKFFKPEIFNYEESIFDRPHNKFIEILSTTGILGLLSFLLIFLIALKKSLDPKKPIFSGILWGFFFAYLVNNFFIFDIQASWLPLFFILSSLTSPPSVVEWRRLNFQKIEKLLLVLAVTCFIFLVIINSFHYYVLYSMVKFLRTAPHQPKSAVELLKKFAPRAGPYLTELGIQLTKLIPGQGIKDLNQKDILFVYKTFNRAYQKDSKDLRLATNYFVFLLFFSSQKEFANQAKKVVEDLENSFPKFPDVYILKATYLFEIEKKQDQAIEIINQLKKQIPRSKRIRKVLLTFYLKANRFSEAFQELEDAKKIGFNYQDAPEQVLKTLLVNNKIKEAQELLNKKFQNALPPREFERLKRIFQKLTPTE